MLNTSSVFYYLFKGDWYDIFSRLLDDNTTIGNRKFDIWEPLDRHKDYNVMVVYGVPLTFNFCIDNKIWKSHEKIFDTFYCKRESEYNVHSSYYSDNSKDKSSDQLVPPQHLVKRK